MSPSMMGALAEGVVPILAGLWMTLTGYRVLGPKPGASEERDQWHAKYGRFFRIGGLLVMLGGLVLLAVGVAREWRPAADGWVRRTTTDGACSIEFPQPPKHEVNPGGEEADRLEVALADRNANYSLTFSDVSSETSALPLDKQFDLLRALYTLKLVGGNGPVRLVKEAVTGEPNGPGREYQFAVGDQLVTRIKVFIRGPRVYRAIVANPPDAKLDRDAQRFIDSFRFEIAKP